MKQSLWRSALALLLVFTQLVAFAPATLAQQESKEERELRRKQEQDRKKEEERKAREDKNRTKEKEKYSTLLEFSQDLYSRDPDFRLEVDKSYLNLQGQHAMQAYRINTQRNTELVYAETEDAGLKIRRVLYDNPWVQDYVNRVGQRLVPGDSDKLYAFKVTYHPIPYAFTLSTGTILISTGMISMLDNEAQLAYVLGHELAHVYKNHWKVKLMMEMGQEEYNVQQAKKVARWGALLGVAGAAVGGAVGRNAEGVLTGGGIGLLAGVVLGAIFNRQIGVDWESVQENEADDLALNLTFEKFYDAQEIPKIYTAMDDVARYDERVQLGFLGLRPRIKERREHIDKQLNGAALKARYDELVKASKLTGNSPDYNLVMAELKRDNGIEAYRFDMFHMARRNLGQAVNMRSDDVRATFYYGRVLKLVGRTPEELADAKRYLATAVTQDKARLNLPEVKLQEALLLMEAKDPRSAEVLKEYIIEYQRRRVEETIHGGTVPPNLDTLYDLMRIFGKELRWEPGRPELSVPMTASAPSSAGESRGATPHPTPKAEAAPAKAPTIQEQVKEGLNKNPLNPKKRTP